MSCQLWFIGEKYKDLTKSIENKKKKKPQRSIEWELKAISVQHGLKEHAKIRDIMKVIG